MQVADICAFLCLFTAVSKPTEIEFVMPIPRGNRTNAVVIFSVNQYGKKLNPKLFYVLPKIFIFLRVSLLLIICNKSISTAFQVKIK